MLPTDALTVASGVDDDDAASSVTADTTYNVLVIGSPGVGKTTMTQQLLTSEYLANKECNAADDVGEFMTCTTVSVQIDDEESTVRFIDNHATEGRDGAGTFKGLAGGDGYLVVYSVTDRSSFRYAQACLQELRPAKRLNAVILVANKYDLVRNRVVSTSEGIRLATKRHCKFVEISALLDHRIDELLVGIVRQIRLRQSCDAPGQSTRADEPKSAGSRLVTALGGALRTLLTRMRVATPTSAAGRRSGTARRQAECNNLFTP
jgi:GTPase SAR1 family protein